MYSAVAYNWCSNEGVYDLVGCTDLAEAIARSLNNTLAFRAGAVCHRMRECLPELITPQNSSCNGTLSNANATGALDLCSLEGIANGTPIAGIFSGQGNNIEACVRFLHKNGGKAGLKKGSCCEADRA
jgi:hypothetical protein